LPTRQYAYEFRNQVSKYIGINGRKEMINKVGNTEIQPKHRASCHCGAVVLELDLPSSGSKSMTMRIQIDDLEDPNSVSMNRYLHSAGVRPMEVAPPGKPP
jgi:hypothetical protein